MNATASFRDILLNKPVQGDAWAATLMSRGGGYRLRLRRYHRTTNSVLP